MDTVDILSAILTVFGITGQIIAVRRPIAGWTIGLGLQPIWYAFYLTVGSPLMLVLSTGFAASAALHLRKAIRARGASRQSDTPDILDAGHMAPPVR